LDVLPALEDGVTSIRCLNRLRLVRQAAAGTPGAEEFCAGFDTINQTPAATHAQHGHDIPANEANVPA
jgi:hypothetical protein